MPHCNYSRQRNRLRKRAITELQQQYYVNMYAFIYIHMPKNNTLIGIASAITSRVVGAAAAIEEATAAQR